MSDDKGGKMTNFPVTALRSNRLHIPVSDGGTHHPLRGDGRVRKQSLLYTAGCVQLVAVHVCCKGHPEASALPSSFQNVGVSQVRVNGC